MKKWKLVVSWILRIVVALGFLMASLGKLSNAAAVVEMFQNWGFPNGFHFVIGALELGLAVLLLIPKTLKIAIIGLLVIMVGATITHLMQDPISEIIRPLVFSGLLVSIYRLNSSVTL